MENKETETKLPTLAEQKADGNELPVGEKSRSGDVKALNFIFLFLAGVINALGVTLFLFPVKLYDSGISGLSMLSAQVTPSFLTLPIFLLVLNIPIFVIGAKKQGLAFTVYSVFAIAVYSLVAYLIMEILPIDVSILSPLAGSDLLLCAIFGGILSGVGSGLAIRFGGAIDGVDVLSVLFAKKIGISIGTFVLIFNVILYIVCGIAISSWILPLYSIVTYIVGSKTVDYIVEGFNRAKCAMIVTTKANEIAEEISAQFGASGTIVNAIGGFSKENKQIIYFVVNQFQINKLKTVVHSIDRQAFISLQDVSDIVKTQKDFTDKAQ